MEYLIHYASFNRRDYQENIRTLAYLCSFSASKGNSSAYSLEEDVVYKEIEEEDVVYKESDRRTAGYGNK